MTQIHWLKSLFEPTHSQFPMLWNQRALTAWTLELSIFFLGLLITIISMFRVNWIRYNNDGTEIWNWMKILVGPKNRTLICRFVGVRDILWAGHTEYSLIWEYAQDEQLSESLSGNALLSRNISWVRNRWFRGMCELRVQGYPPWRVLKSLWLLVNFKTNPTMDDGKFPC